MARPRGGDGPGCEADTDGCAGGRSGGRHPLPAGMQLTAAVVDVVLAGHPSGRDQCDHEEKGQYYSFHVVLRVGVILAHSLVLNEKNAPSRP